MEKHTKDPNTGLLYHGWDETKAAAWADPATGLAPEFWGRAIGWYPVALLEMFEYLPEDHKDKAKLTSILQDLLIALTQYQDVCHWLMVSGCRQRQTGRIIGWKIPARPCMFMPLPKRSIRLSGCQVFGICLERLSRGH